jgi:WhiB family transcriptional regulator, redox-sensing transcriptional regulator
MQRQRRPAATARRYELGPAAAPIDAPWGFACARDPERWTTTADEGAKALCRSCPRRWVCAQQACKTPGAEGVWAGIRIPEAGRSRQFALSQLRSLAEHNGYPVRTMTH